MTGPAAGTSAVLAACGAAVALLLLLPLRSRLPGRAGSTRDSPVGAPALAVVPVLGSPFLVLWLDGVRLALGLVVLTAAAGAAALVRRGRRHRQRAQVQARVAELSEALVGELRAGRPVIAALERGSTLWPPFAPAAAAARLGADVPAALRDLAVVPGAEGLARLAGAWDVSLRTGCSLVGVLEQVGRSVRAESASAQLVRAELSSAQATARLVAVLPVATLTMASGSGSDPWRFLLATPAGLVCLAVGAALVLLGLWWIDLIAAAAAGP